MADKKVLAATLALDSGQATQSMKSFRQELRESTNELHRIQTSFGELSPQAVAAAKRVSELKDRIGDARNLVDAFSPDRKFQAIEASVRGIAGGFSALQGIVALTNGNSKELEQTLVKLQAALAISSGVNNILELQDTFKNLGTVIQNTTLFQQANNFATKAAATVQRLFAGSVDTTSTSFKVLKGAIAATGIGLLVVAVGQVIEAFQAWSAAAEDAAKRQKELMENTKRFADIGLKAEMESIGRQEKLEIARANAKGASEKQIFDIQQKYQRLRINSQNRHWQELEGVDEVGANESRKQSENFQTDLYIKQLEFDKKMLDQRKEQEKKRADQAKAAAEKQKQELKDYLERENNAQIELAKLKDKIILASIKDEDERKRQEIEREAYWEGEKIKALKISERTKTALLKELKISSDLELSELDKTISDRKREEDQQRLQEGLNRTLSFLQAEGNAVKKNAEERKATEQAVYENKLALARATSDIISGLGELVGRQTALGKVLALTTIAIDTAVGFVQGLRIAQQSAAATGPAAVFAFPIFYASQVAAVIGAASRAKAILSSGGSSASSSASSGGSLSSVSMPAPTPPSQTSTRLHPEDIRDIGNAAAGGVNRGFKTFVLDSDVEHNRERNERLNRAARLGGG